jgi:ribonucleoside-diphosphate reductase alpha chain
MTMPQLCISLGVRFLDDVIDVNHYPLPQIEQRVRLNRKIGLGLMGLADAFLIMELTYDDAAALAFAEKLATFFGRHAREASEELGKERGFYPQTAQLGHKNTQPPRRNACVTTVAPTGTISLLCGCSPGIEPVYSFITQRNILSGKPVVDLHPYFEAICSDEKISLSDTLDWLGRQTHTSLNTYEKISANIRRLLKTATAIDWKTHIDMQAIFQNHVDNGVSKTINLATSATEQTIWDAYMYAFHKRCKGITVYRHRSRKQQSQTLPSPVHETCGTPLIAREGCLYCPQCSISLCGTE